MDVNTTTSTARESGSRKTERGDLIALSVTAPNQTFQKGDCYVRVYLAVSGTSKTETQIELLGDYLYEGHTPSFHGRIPLVQDTNVVVDVWTDIATQIRVNGTIEDKG